MASHTYTEQSGEFSRADDGEGDPAEEEEGARADVEEPLPLDERRHGGVMGPLYQVVCKGRNI